MKVYPNFYAPLDIRPLGDLVILRRVRGEVLDYGLVIPHSLESIQRGVVLRVGPGERILEEGDTVLFLERTGQPVYPATDRFEQNAMERDLLAMHECHVVAALESDA